MCTWGGGRGQGGGVRGQGHGLPGRGAGCSRCAAGVRGAGYGARQGCASGGGRLKGGFQERLQQRLLAVGGQGVNSRAGSPKTVGGQFGGEGGEKQVGH